MGNKANTEITHTYGIDKAHEVIQRSMDDYHERFHGLESMLSI
jgi:inorganic pyrophosphatase